MTISRNEEVQLGAQGRLVIPATLRRALKLSPGDRLAMHQEGDRLVLETRAAIAQRVRRKFADARQPGSLVDELIAQRRAEALQERNR